VPPGLAPGPFGRSAPPAMTTGPATLLFVDDETNTLNALKRVFADQGHRVLLANGPAQALEVLSREPVDLLCSDQNMPGRTGLDLLKEVRERWPHIKRLMLTVVTDAAVMREAVESGAVYKYLNKPWDDDDLKMTVRRALEHGHLESAHDRLRDRTSAQEQMVEKIDRLWDRPRGTLGYVLEKAGLATADQMAAAGRERRAPETLIETLARMDLVTEAQVLRAVAEAQHIPTIELEGVALAADAVKMVPREICEKGRLAPVRVENDRLVVAFADPTDVVKIENLAIVTGLPVTPLAATPSGILKSLDRFFGDSPAYTSLQDFEKQVQYDHGGRFDLVVEEEEPNALDKLFTGTDEASVVRLVNAIVFEGLKSRASDIHIEPKTRVSLVRYRVDGMLQTRLKIPAPLHAPTMSRLKILAKLDIAERRRPQDGRLTLKAGPRLIDVRLSTMPTVEGEKMVLRILDTSGAVKKVADVGFAAGDLLRLSPLLRRPQGIVLSTGPTGSGKTTTLYAILNETLSPYKNYETIEDPVEYRLEGANQVQVRENLGLSFAATLRCTLRQDPDVILLGEIRDEETADVAFKAALTGHLVLSTLHTNSTVASLTRLIDIGVKPYLLASALEGIIAQRLVRRICESCRTRVEPAAETLALLRLRPEDFPTAFAGTGCERCDHSGYRGRTGLFELMVVTDELRRGIAGGVEESAVTGLARAAGMRTLLEDGLEKARAGVTTLEEVLRVMGPPTRYEEPCGACRRPFEVTHGFCPFCGSERRNRCGGCHRTLEPLWSHCPGCGQKRSLPTARSAL